MEEDRDRDQVRNTDRSRDFDRAYDPRDRDGERSRDQARTRDRDRVRERGRSDSRIVERWIEREYDVPSDDRAGRRRRVTVIERDNGRSERAIERSDRRGDFFFGSGGFPFGF